MCNQVLGYAYRFKVQFAPTLCLQQNTFHLSLFTVMPSRKCWNEQHYLFSDSLGLSFIQKNSNLTQSLIIPGANQV